MGFKVEAAKLATQEDLAGAQTPLDSQHAQGSTYGHLELRQAVGDLFFVWSSMEKAIRDEIENLETTPRGSNVQGISGSIKHLKKLHYEVAKGRINHIHSIDEVVQFLSDALADRNLIAHGIRGWHGNSDHEAAILVLELNQRRKELTLASLRSTTEKLGFIASKLGWLTFAAMSPPDTNIGHIYDEIGDRIRRD